MTTPIAGDTTLTVPAVNVAGKQIPLAVPTGIPKVGDTVTVIPTEGGQVKYSAAVTTTPAVGDTVAVVPLQGGGAIKWAAVNGGDAKYTPKYVLSTTIPETPFRLAVDAGFLYVGTYGTAKGDGAVFKFKSSDLSEVGLLYRGAEGRQCVSAQGGYVFTLAGTDQPYLNRYDSSGNYLGDMRYHVYWMNSGADRPEIANWGAEFWIRGFYMLGGVNYYGYWSGDIFVENGPVAMDAQYIYCVGDTIQQGVPYNTYTFKRLYIRSRAEGAGLVTVQLDIPSGGIPGQIASDGTRLYLCDPANHRIVYMDLAGAVIGTFGTYGLTAGLLNQPVGIAVDGDYIYIANYGDKRIQKFTKSGKYESSVVYHDPNKIMVIPVANADRATIATALLDMPVGLWEFAYSTTAAPGTDWVVEPTYGVPWPIRDYTVAVGPAIGFPGATASGAGCPHRAGVLMYAGEPSINLTQRIWHEILHGVTGIESPDTMHTSAGFVAWMTAHYPSHPFLADPAGYPNTTEILLYWDEYLTEQVRTL
jgi:hypothetical protein